MICIFIGLLLVGALNANIFRSQRTASCSWNGHCAGDPCSTYEDCSKPLLCLRGQCGTLNNNKDDKKDGTCLFSGVLRGTNTKCNTQSLFICCKQGVSYLQYKCSPSSKSSAVLTLNSFANGVIDGYGGACYNKFYPDSQPVVALSTGWYNDGSRCGKMIKIRGNGKTTTALVVDECDSMYGCDADHAGQPPCRNNIVDASPAVWAALGVSKNDPRYGEMGITWSD